MAHGMDKVGVERHVEGVKHNGYNLRGELGLLWFT